MKSAARFDLVRVGSAGSPGFVEITETSRRVEELRQLMCDAKAKPLMALMVAFHQPLAAVPFDAVAVMNSDKIQWVARNSSKPGEPENPGDGTRHDPGFMPIF